MPTVVYPHIEIDAGGVPLVAGTTTKVVEIVLDRLAHHWDAEEIRRQHPHLSLAQIYSALAYYHDLPSAITRGLRQRGIDVLTADEDQTLRWDDEPLL